MYPWAFLICENFCFVSIFDINDAPEKSRFLGKKVLVAQPTL